MNTRKISKAFDEVALLTRAIELSVTRYADGDEGTSTAIDTLHDFIINQEDSPKAAGPLARPARCFARCKTLSGCFSPTSGACDANEATATAAAQ